VRREERSGVLTLILRLTNKISISDLGIYTCKYLLFRRTLELSTLDIPIVEIPDPHAVCFHLVVTAFSTLAGQHNNRQSITTTSQERSILSYFQRRSFEFLAETYR
jgi:hypothetical protein